MEYYTSEGVETGTCSQSQEGGTVDVGAPSEMQFLDQDLHLPQTSEALGQFVLISGRRWTDSAGGSESASLALREFHVQLDAAKIENGYHQKKAAMFAQHFTRLHPRLAASKSRHRSEARL